MASYLKVTAYRADTWAANRGGKEEVTHISWNDECHLPCSLEWPLKKAASLLFIENYCVIQQGALPGTDIHVNDRRGTL